MADFDFSDLNLDFLQSTPPKSSNSDEPRTATPVPAVRHEIYFQKETVGESRKKKRQEWAKKISSADRLMKEIQNLKCDNLQLQTQLKDFQTTALDIQRLYATEKEQHEIKTKALEELKKQYEKIETELVVKSLECDQFEACLEDQKERPVDYNDLVMKYLRLVNKLEGEDMIRNFPDRGLAEELKQYCAKFKLRYLPARLINSPQKSSSRIRTQKTCYADAAVQCDHVTEAQPTKLETRNQGVQCCVVLRSQGTQHISTMTTRSTTTSCFISYRNVGTSSSDLQTMPPAVDDILRELVPWQNIKPVSPLIDIQQLTEEAKPTFKTIGTCTWLCNIRRPIDFIPRNKIKRSTTNIELSEATAHNTLNRTVIKQEMITPSPSPTPNATSSQNESTANATSNRSPVTNISTNPLLSAIHSNPLLSHGANPTFHELWHIFGRMVLGLLHTTNDSNAGIAASTQDSVNQQQFHNWLREIYDSSILAARETPDIGHTSTTTQQEASRTQSVGTSPLHFNESSVLTSTNIVRPEARRTIANISEVEEMQLAGAEESVHEEDNPAEMTLACSSSQLSTQLNFDADSTSSTVKRPIPCTSVSADNMPSKKPKSAEHKNKSSKSKCGSKIMEDIKELFPELKINKSKRKHLKRLLKGTKQKKQKTKCKSQPISEHEDVEPQETAIDFLKEIIGRKDIAYNGERFEQEESIQSDAESYLPCETSQDCEHNTTQNEFAKRENRDELETLSNETYTKEDILKHSVLLRSETPTRTDYESEQRECDTENTANEEMYNQSDSDSLDSLPQPTAFRSDLVSTNLRAFHNLPIDNLYQQKTDDHTNSSDPQNEQDKKENLCTDRREQSVNHHPSNIQDLEQAEESTQYLQSRQKILTASFSFTKPVKKFKNPRVSKKKELYNSLFGETSDTETDEYSGDDNQQNATKRKKRFTEETHSHKSMQKGNNSPTCNLEPTTENRAEDVEHGYASTTSYDSTFSIPEIPTPVLRNAEITIMNNLNTGSSLLLETMDKENQSILESIIERELEENPITTNDETMENIPPIDFEKDFEISSSEDDQDNVAPENNRNLAVNYIRKDSPKPLLNQNTTIKNDFEMSSSSDDDCEDVPADSKSHADEKQVETNSNVVSNDGVKESPMSSLNYEKMVKTDMELFSSEEEEEHVSDENKTNVDLNEISIEMANDSQTSSCNNNCEVSVEEETSNIIMDRTENNSNTSAVCSKHESKNCRMRELLNYRRKPRQQSPRLNIEEEIVFYSDHKYSNVDFKIPSSKNTCLHSSQNESQECFPSNVPPNDERLPTNFSSSVIREDHSAVPKNSLDKQDFSQNCQPKLTPIFNNICSSKRECSNTTMQVEEIVDFPTNSSNTQRDCSEEIATEKIVTEKILESPTPTDSLNVKNGPQDSKEENVSKLDEIYVQSTQNSMESSTESHISVMDSSDVTNTEYESSIIEISSDPAESDKTRDTKSPFNELVIDEDLPEENEKENNDSLSSQDNKLITVGNIEKENNDTFSANGRQNNVFKIESVGRTTISPSKIRISFTERNAPIGDYNKDSSLSPNSIKSPPEHDKPDADQANSHTENVGSDDSINPCEVSSILNSSICNDILTESMCPIVDDILQNTDAEAILQSPDANVPKKRGRKRKSECQPEPAAQPPCKRSERIKAKHIIFEKSLKLSVSPVEIGKYTRVSNRQNMLKNETKSISKKCKESSDTKTPVQGEEQEVATRIGFFRELDEVSMEEEKTGDNTNDNLENIKNNSVSLPCNTTFVADQIQDIRTNPKRTLTTPLENNSPKAEHFSTPFKGNKTFVVGDKNGEANLNLNRNKTFVVGDTIEEAKTNCNKTFVVVGNKSEETKSNLLNETSSNQVTNAPLPDDTRLVVNQNEQITSPQSPLAMAPENYDSPMSPQNTTEDILNTTTLDIPLELLPECRPQRKHSSLMESLIQNFSIVHYNTITLTKCLNEETFSKKQRSLTSYYNDLLKSYCYNPLQIDPDIHASKIVKKLQNDTIDYSLFYHCILKIVKQSEPSEVKEHELPSVIQEMPPRHLNLVLQRMFYLMKHLMMALQPYNCCEQLKLRIESLLFNCQQAEKISLHGCLHLTQLYLITCKFLETQVRLHPARLYVAKCLYFYSIKAINMIHEVLLWYPSVLPPREDPVYDRSDALITVIQHCLMSTKYDMTNTDMRGKSLISKLRFEYHYDPFKPNYDDVISNLTDKLRSSKLNDDITFAFGLFSYRMYPIRAENILLKTHLLPLANEFFEYALVNSDYDIRISALLEIISIIVKPFPQDWNVEIYLDLFSRFLNGFSRKIIQEAAVCSILRLQRFGYVNCFNRLRAYRPTYELEPRTQAMFKSFIHRKKLDYLKQIQRQSPIQ
ncbi:little elongation complex subunit 1 [Musca domestica]|uniref:Little elongation complex subunit 1 n=1 Tax=Musca domestica TaxID=7370 RepID=A0A1I8M9H0_MUSDO|nr:little elongation complex subunit 1 [Musca domestica]